MNIPVIAGLSEIASRYRGFVLDVWGVVHQGGPAFPEAIACLEELERRALPVVFLSNAPRRAGHVEALLERKGIARHLHRGVISSGEVARMAFACGDHPELAVLGPSFLMIGAEHDDDLLDGLAYRRVHNVRDADFLLAIGLDDARPTVGHHEAVLNEAAARRVPMVCVNPDLVVVRLGVRELCAGALAARYRELDGCVSYFGKPYASAYPPAMRALGVGSSRDVLAVGDGLETDIKGAAAAGLGSLLVTGGILADALGLDRLAAPSPAALAEACAEAGVRPDAAIAVLRW